MDLNERLEELNAPKRMGPFRRAVLRGLAVLLPPLLTIVIFLWVGHTVGEYLLEPLENAMQSVAVQHFADIRTPDESEGQAKNADAVVIDGKSLPVSSKGAIKLGDQVYHRTEDGKFVPLGVYKTVLDGVGREPMPTTATDVYRWYVEHRWLQRRIHRADFHLRFPAGVVLARQVPGRGRRAVFLESVRAWHSPLAASEQCVFIDQASDGLLILRARDAIHAGRGR